MKESGNRPKIEPTSLRDILQNLANDKAELANALESLGLPELAKNALITARKTFRLAKSLGKPASTDTED